MGHSLGGFNLSVKLSRVLLGPRPSSNGNDTAQSGEGKLNFVSESVEDTWGGLEVGTYHVRGNSFSEDLVGGTHFLELLVH